MKEISFIFGKANDVNCYFVFNSLQIEAMPCLVLFLGHCSDQMCLLCGGKCSILPTKLSVSNPFVGLMLFNLTYE